MLGHLDQCVSDHFPDDVAATSQPTTLQVPLPPLISPKKEELNPNPPLLTPKKEEKDNKPENVIVSPLPPCKYGVNCYQSNSNHLQAYSHLLIINV